MILILARRIIIMQKMVYLRKIILELMDMVKVQPQVHLMLIIRIKLLQLK